MRKIFLFLMFVALDVAAQKNIVVLHSNDCHSQIVPFNSNLSDKTKAGLGGFLRRVSFVKQQRKQSPDLLLFDSGDFSQGSSYYSLYKGDVEIGLMNIMGYDAATIGNHEFDYGLDNMARIFKMAKFPVVCTNYDFSGTVLERVVKPYVVIKRNGVRIGVFGLSPRLEGLVVRDNFGSVKYLDPIACTKDVVKTLRQKEKCDVVICLSHLGWELSQEEISDERLVPAIEGVDIILGGHTHDLFNPAKELNDAKGQKVYISQNGKGGVNITRFDLRVK